MALPNLWNLPTTPETLAIFSFSNMDEHRKAAQQILVQLNATITLRPLDPIPLADIGAWAYNHQLVHNQQNAVLGIAGNDLTTVDFNDLSQLVNWIQLHAQEHYQASQILGLD